MIDWRPIGELNRDNATPVRPVLLWLGNWVGEDKPRLAYWFHYWGNWQPSDHWPDVACDEYSGIGAELPTHFAYIDAPGDSE